MFFILLLPVVAGLISMALISLFIKPMSYFIIGLGGVITGIAIDYGVHVYVAVMHNTADVPHDSIDVDNRVKQVARPVIIGCLTTAGIFWHSSFQMLQDIINYLSLQFSALSFLFCLLCFCYHSFLIKIKL